MFDKEHLDRIEAKLDRALRLLYLLAKLEKREMSKLTETVSLIAADSVANKNAYQSVKDQVSAQYAAFGAQIQALKDQLASTGDVDKAIADLTDIHTQFQGEAADMAAGITANAALSSTPVASSIPADAPPIPAPSTPATADATTAADTKPAA